jgi:L-malate glycosyltransferase
VTPGRARVAIMELAVREYRFPFYEALRAELDHRGVQLALVHSTPPRDLDVAKDVTDLPWGRSTRMRRLNLRGRELLWQHAPPGLWESDLVIVNQASRLLVNYHLLARRRLGGPLVAFWGHGRSPYRDANPLGEAVKRWVATEADWWFAYTDDVADLVAELGYPRERISSVRNSTDTRAMRARVDAVTSADIDRLRAETGIEGQRVGLFLGALRPEKRLDHVIAAAEAVRSHLPDFELVVVGDGPLASWVQGQADRLPWLHYAGQRFGDELAALLKLSSVLLMPAWVGLVITDGLAAGRPLVASAAAPHGPEITYLQHGRNGLLIDDDGDPQRYGLEVAKVLQDTQLMRRLQENAAEDASLYGLEQMVERYADGVIGALHAGRR